MTRSEIEKEIFEEARECYAQACNENSEGVSWCAEKIIELYGQLLDAEDE